MQEWRLLDTPPMTAVENMALDEVLLELKGKRRTPHTIRYLQFKPRCVLVGFQGKPPAGGSGCGRRREPDGLTVG